MRSDHAEGRWHREERKLCDRNEKTYALTRYAIDIVSVNKRFKRTTAARGGYTTLKSAVLRCFFGSKGNAAVYTEAIKNLTLRIPQGLSVGVIGRNGSGKSTLLKLITGIYRPDVGRVSVNGRVAALIELGAGFHPDFSGRENLYLGGMLHGLSRREIKQRFDEIVRFAELEKVIDDAVPVSYTHLTLPTIYSV